MCGVSGVGGAAGCGGMTMAGGPGQVGQHDGHGKVPGQVGGDSGPGQVAQGGGPEGAAAGASALSAALSALNDAVKSLNELIAKMQSGATGGGGCGGDMHGGHVAGVQGQAASDQEYVTRVNLTAAASTANSEDHEFEQRVLELINAERARHGLSQVTYNARLDNAAEKHAHHMSLVNAMAHSGIGDGDPGERIRAEGFSAAWGENVATGQTSPEQVVAEWMASPTHRRNILDPNFRQMGVGYVTSASGRSYWAQEFGA